MKTTAITAISALLMCPTHLGLGQDELVQAAAGAANSGLPNVFHGTGNSVSAVKTKSRDSAPPVVIQFSTTDRTAVAAMEEDLAVMTRIIEKALDGGLGEEKAMGIPLLVTKGSRSVRALHVEGLGALFMIKVNFPLLPPPKVEEKKPEPAATSEWENARRELDGVDVQTEERWDALDAAGSDYDEEQVEGLKNTLLLALKQASNMKHVKPDDSIIVSVFGTANTGASVAGAGVVAKPRIPGAAPATTKQRKPAIPDAPTAGEPDPSVQPPSPVEPKVTRSRTTGLAVQEGQEVLLMDAAGRGMSRISSSNRRAAGETVLTLRVKKSDLDAFAKGTLSLEAIQKRTIFNAYVGSGHGIASVNTWIGTRF